MSDLISRKAVLEEIRKIECEPGYQHVGEDWAVGLNIAENIVESAESIESTPSAEPDRRWIPVTEAMPEEDKDVLLLMAEGEMAVGQRRGVNYWDGYRRRAVIIAWMPLPEPWRGE